MRTPEEIAIFCRAQMLVNKPMDAAAIARLAVEEAVEEAAALVQKSFRKEETAMADMIRSHFAKLGYGVKL